VIENNPGRVNSGDSLGRVMAALAVSGILALAMIVAAVLAAIVLPAGARIPLLAFEVGALLLAAGRETPVRSE
jgi:carbon starvation protein CstA